MITKTTEEDRLYSEPLREQASLGYGQHAHEARANVSYFETSDIDFILQTRATPLFILDIHAVRKQVARFANLLPDVPIYYSTKTNPHPAIIEALSSMGHGFDVATLEEVRLVLKHGARPEDLIFTHPVKTVEEMLSAYELGVRKFTCDSISELKRHEKYIPFSEHYVRIAPISNASLYDYKNKFGATPDDLESILDYARIKGLNLAGISFMTGSQSLSIDPWLDMFRYLESVIRKYYHSLPSLRTINIGSGFPIQYGFSETVSLDDIAIAVQDFSKKIPSDMRLVSEPGRYLVAPSTILATSVVQRIQRGSQDWLYTDANAYSGLIEIIESGGRFPYRITTRQAGPTKSFMIAGKTLDPDDILGSNVQLNALTGPGDILFVRDAGAYTSSFLTNYHSLPYPEIVVCDSEYVDNVSVATNKMGVTGLRAKRKIKSGETVFNVSGYHSAQRTRTTFQTSKEGHTEPSLYGAFLNHSCNPNVGTHTKKDRNGVLSIIARQDINTGDDVVIDYAMFEYETGPMAKVRCLCGSDLCRGTITGHKDLAAKTRNMYKGWVADHLE
jgi:ornithine decarboxylase